MSTDRIVHAACPHDCPDSCAIEVTVRDGIAIKIAGAAAHPPTGGVLCAKVNKYAERVYHPDRVLYPMRRVGAKGEGRFERATWDEALTDIAARLGDIAARDPNRIVPYSYAGTMGLVQGESIAARFFNRIGASRLDRTICASAGAEALRLTFGAGVGMDMEQFANAKLILLWGTNAIASNLHLWTRIQQAKRDGAILVAIDPYASDTAQKCHKHLAIQPGTDAALALAIIHVLVRDDLLDHDYIAQHTLGFDALAERAQKYTPAYAAALTGLDAADIEWLATLYGDTAVRQQQPVAIRANYGMQRARGGANAVRAVACLPALVGAWRQPAGGFLLSTSGWFPVDRVALERPELLAGRTPRTVNMSVIGDALLNLNDYADAPPVEAVIVYNSNPVAVAPESAKVAQGFAREDIFTVVLEHFQTDTADYADWLLPATTQLEHVDVVKPYGHAYIMSNEAAIAPMGECKPNTQFFRELSLRMGLDEACLQDSDDLIAQQAFNVRHPHAQGYVFDEVRKQGWMRLNIAPGDVAPFAKGGFPTASGRCEFASTELAARGQDPVPDYLPPYESGLDSPLALRFPLSMISPPARNFLNSTFVNVTSLRNIEGVPALWLHPDDASQRGIEDGSQVRVFNDRGSQQLQARVTARARRGVVVAPSIWWKKLSPDGRNANELTSQALTDMGRAPTFYDTRVEVEAA